MWSLYIWKVDFGKVVSLSVYGKEFNLVNNLIGPKESGISPILDVLQPWSCRSSIIEEKYQCKMLLKFSLFICHNCMRLTHKKKVHRSIIHMMAYCFCTRRVFYIYGTTSLELSILLEEMGPTSLKLSTYSTNRQLRDMSNVECLFFNLILVLVSNKKYEHSILE